MKILSQKEISSPSSISSSNQLISSITIEISFLFLLKKKIFIIFNNDSMKILPKNLFSFFNIITESIIQNRILIFTITIEISSLFLLKKKVFIVFNNDSMKILPPKISSPSLISSPNQLHILIFSITIEISFLFLLKKKKRIFIVLNNDFMKILTQKISFPSSISSSL